MKRILFIMVMILQGAWMSAQTYSSMWKQVEDFGDKDLPQSQIEVLQKLKQKAEKEKSYGNLLKAELMEMKLKTEISQDSLRPAIERIAAKERNTKDEALDAVYCGHSTRRCAS